MIFVYKHSSLKERAGLKRGFRPAVSRWRGCLQGMLSWLGGSASPELPSRTAEPSLRAWRCTWLCVCPVSTAKLRWLWRTCRDVRSAWCPDRGICDYGGRATLRLLPSWSLTWPSWPSSACPRRAGRCICWPGPAPARQPAPGAAWCRGGCTAATSGALPTPPAAARKYSSTCRSAGSSAATRVRQDDVRRAGAGPDRPLRAADLRPAEWPRTYLYGQPAAAAICHAGAYSAVSGIRRAFRASGSGPGRWRGGWPSRRSAVASLCGSRRPPRSTGPRRCRSAIAGRRA
jgi:hypothetical protein